MPAAALKMPVFLLVRRVLLTLAPVLLVVAVLAASWGRSLYYLSHGLLAQTLPPVGSPDPRIVLVALDDATLEDPQMPVWGPGILRRSAHGRLLDELREGGAAIVGFDIAFIGKSEPGEDAALRAALDRASSTVLAVEARPKSPDNTQDRFLEPEPLLADARSVRLASPTVRRFGFTSEVLGVEMEQSRGDGRTLNALSFECYKAALGQDDLGASHTYGRVGANDLMIIRWSGGPYREAFRAISYRDVWSGAWKRQAPDLFRGKTVLVGSFATMGNADILNTPVGKMPGVAVHAFALRTLFNRDWIRNDSYLATWVVAVLAALAVCLSLYLLRPWAALGAMVATCLLVVAVSVLAFRARYWIGPFEPILSASLAGLFGFVVRSAFARQSLERFAGVEAAGYLEREGAIQTRVQEATIVFADVRGYTALSETLSPAELMDVLNEHFEWMDGIIIRHGGRVDKHIGDALLAVFEETRRGPGHAERAVAAAREMLQTANCRRGPAAEIGFGVGLHTGEISKGILGQKRGKQEYGIIGDAVNVAARLEQSTRLLDVPVLISEETVRHLKTGEGLRRLEPLRLKGKAEPVGVYTLDP